MLSKVRRITRIEQALLMIAQATTRKAFLTALTKMMQVVSLCMPVFHSSTLCYASLTVRS